MISYSARLDSMSKRWPTELRQELYRYLSRFQASDKAPYDYGNEPYWLLFPSWLAQKYNRKKTNRIRKAVLDDIVWAQYCTFLTLRIQDDLYDEQGKVSKLLFATDIFLAEAHNIYSQYLPYSNRFWALNKNYLQESILAIWEVDIMQQRRSVSLKQIRSGYAQECSIFKIGSAAVCNLTGRLRDFNLVEAAVDELAIAGQIYDDLQDMDEDLKRGRLNYATRFILGSSNISKVDFKKATDLVAINLLSTNRMQRLLNRIIKHVHRADNILAPLKLSNAHQYLSEYVSSLEIIADALGQEQARQIFKRKID